METEKVVDIPRLRVSYVFKAVYWLFGFIRISFAPKSFYYYFLSWVIKVILVERLISEIRTKLLNLRLFFVKLFVKVSLKVLKTVFI